MIDTSERLNVRACPVPGEILDNAFHGSSCRPYQVPTSGFKRVPCRIRGDKRREDRDGEAPLPA